MKRRFRQIAAAVEGAVNDSVIFGAMRVQANLTTRTPIDVGTARSNWRLTLGSPASGTIPAYRPYPSRWRPPYGPGGSFSERRNKLAADAQGRGVAGFRRGQAPLYITNNLPYIGELDRGHSRQAPAGFVGVAVADARAQLIRRLRSELRRRLRE